MAAIVALDLDGVLNPSARQPRWTFAEVTFPAEEDLPSSLFVNRSLAGQTRQVIVPAPAVIERLLALPARLVWATTWEHLANDLYGPVAGIPPLDVIPLSVIKPRFGDVQSGDTTSWKMAGISGYVEVADTVVLVDDRASRWVGREELWRDAPTKIVAPDHRIGITGIEIAGIEAFLAEHS